MAVRKSTLAFALLCVYLTGTVYTSENGVWTGSEDELYQSFLWEPNFGSIVMAKELKDSQEEYERLQEQLGDTNAHFAKVSCGDKNSHGEVCGLLSEHTFAVKDGNKVVGVDVSKDGNDVVNILQALLGERLNTITSYSELKAFAAQHDNLFLAYVVNTSSYEYQQLLKFWLTSDLPLFVTNKSTTLPLTYRPLHTYTAHPLHLWFVLQSGERWIRFNLQGMDTMTQEDRMKAFNDELFSFVDRLQYPIVADYSVEIEKTLSATNFHLVYLFPGVEESLDLNTLAHNLAKVSYTHFVFIIAKRGTEIAHRLLVTPHRKLSMVVLLPFASEEDRTAVDIESSNLKEEMERLRGILETFAIDHREEKLLEENADPVLLSVVDPLFLQMIIEQKETNILVAFCQKDTMNCPAGSYEALNDLMAAIQKGEYLDKIGLTAAHVAECDSVDQVQLFGFDSLPSYGLYNRTTNKWYRMKKDLTAAYQAMALLVLGSGLDELIGVDLTSSFENVDQSSPFQYEDDNDDSPFSEDDHFGLLLRTLPAAKLPSDAALTSNNFDQHISRFERTVVVFYMSWCIRSQLFLNHIMAAYEQLDKAQNVSLSVVRCDDWTDLCTRMNIITYPTALLFTPSTLHTPTPLASHDTPHILNALGQHPLDSDSNEQLPELTPITLPNLLRGYMSTPLVLWCDVDLNSDKGQEFKQVATRVRESDLSFAWMDSSKYTDLLMRVSKTQQMSFPNVVVFELSKHKVYQLPVKEGQSAQEFGESLESFLAGISSGETTAFAHLGEKSWPPLQTPVKFPSEDYNYGDTSPEEQISEGSTPVVTQEAPPPSKTPVNSASLHQSSHTEL